MNNMFNYMYEWVFQLGANRFWAKIAASTLCSIVVILVGYIISFIAARLASRIVFLKGGSSAYKDKVVGFLNIARLFVFVWILSEYIPVAFDPFPAVNSILQLILNVSVVAICAMTINRMITCLRYAAKSRLKNEVFASKTFSQMLKILVWFTAAIIIMSFLMGKSPAFVLSGLGALTAVLMLIFKDSLLGLVAGIQVSQNDMVRVGDWITMPKYNADGNVIDIALTTVKVQNFDNTVTMIPSSALISDSFINWRYMSTSKGRRIKRPVWISVTSIQELSEDFRLNLVKEGLLNEGDRPISNLAAFEIWLRRMLAADESISQELTCMVRQTETGDTGIPVEVYAFTKTRDWVEYEMIQTNIFDKIFVTVPKFNLRIYQRTGDKQNQLIS
ncbi:MAG: mechanosensitive ion channel [Kiritimatiellae bacterium]|nr:mechanosensitive ion channel [Kiritimatiellia bacterium]